MSIIVDKLKSVPDLLHLNGCVTSQIRDAQQALGIVFPEEYVEYVKEFGAVSFYGAEWTGLNVSGSLNVVTATMQERRLDSSFPNDVFLLENIGVDGLMIVMGEDGKIYSFQHGKKAFLYNSLCEYLDFCVNRKK